MTQPNDDEEDDMIDEDFDDNDVTTRRAPEAKPVGTPKHARDMNNVEAEVAEGILLGVDRARKQQRIAAAMLAQAIKD